jgi:hypothetical protein
MISYEPLDFLNDFNDKLDLTVDLDKILTFNDIESAMPKSSQNEIDFDGSDKEFNDFICGIPKKTSLSFSDRQSIFEDNSYYLDKNVNHQNFLSNIRVKLINMIQKEKRIQDEIRKLLTNE